MNADKEKLRAFLTELLTMRGDIDPYTDTDSLVLSGRLDSFSVVEVVVFVEEEYGIDFSDIPFDQSYFENIESILALIEEQRAD